MRKVVSFDQIIRKGNQKEKKKRLAQARESGSHASQALAPAPISSLSRVSQPRPSRPFLPVRLGSYLGRYLAAIPSPFATVPPPADLVPRDSWDSPSPWKLFFFFFSLAVCGENSDSSLQLCRHNMIIIIIEAHGKRTGAKGVEYHSST